MSVLNNIGALTGVRQLGMTQAGLNETIQRLTTTKRINKASDDAAGLSIAVKLGADVKISAQGQRNAQDGQRFLGVADGALDEVINLLTRGSTLAEQARTGTVDATGRSALDAEYQKISSTVNEIMNNTKFNGAKVFGTGETSTTTTTTNITAAGSASASAARTGLQTDGYMASRQAAFALYSAVGTSETWDIYNNMRAARDNWSTANYPTAAAFAVIALGLINTYVAANPHDLNGLATQAAIQYQVTNAPPDTVPGGAGNTANNSAAADAADAAFYTSTTTTTTTSGSVSIAIGNYANVTLNTDPTGIPGNLGNLLDPTAATAAKTALDNARTAVAKLRGSLGADMSYLSGVSNALGIGMENTTAAYAQIMDADIAQEVVSLTKFQVLNQSGTSALGQANQGSQSVLSLLR